MIGPGRDTCLTPAKPGMGRAKDKLVRTVIRERTEKGKTNCVGPEELNQRKTSIQTSLKPEDE